MIVAQYHTSKVTCFVSTFFTFNQLFNIVCAFVVCICAFSRLDSFLNTSVCFESGVMQIRAVTESHIVLIRDFLTFFIHEHQDSVGDPLSSFKYCRLCHH